MGKMLNRRTAIVTASAVIVAAGIPSLISAAQRRANLIVRNIRWSDDLGLSWGTYAVEEQSDVWFRAVVENIGRAAIPPSKRIRVDFRVDGVRVSWGYFTGLSAGATKIVKASDGTDGDKFWYAAPPGTRRLVAIVDPNKQYHESNETDNIARSEITVLGLPVVSDEYITTPEEHGWSASNTVEENTEAFNLAIVDASRRGT